MLVKIMISNISIVFTLSYCGLFDEIVKLWVFLLSLYGPFLKFEKNDFISLETLLIPNISAQTKTKMSCPNNVFCIHTYSCLVRARTEGLQKDSI